MNAAQRLLGTDAGGTSGGLQPRFRVVGDPINGDGTLNPAAFAVPAPGDYGPYDRFYIRNPGINNHDLSVFKNFPIGSGGRRMLQLRVEMFNVLNHSQFSALNLTTNVANGAGQTGAAIFNNYTGLTATTNVRPAGRRAPARHVLRRAQRGARPPHHPARREALFLMARGRGGQCPS